MPKSIYTLPEDKKTKIRIIKAIPSDWKYLDSTLTAPSELYQSGLISLNTRLKISTKPNFSTEFIEYPDKPFEEFTNGNHGVETNDSLAKRIKNILFRKKEPSSVIIDHLNFIREREVDMKEALQVIKRFMFLGYRWRTTVRTNYTASQQSREEFSVNEYSKFVELEWNPENGGKKESLAEIISKLEKLGLRELNEEDLKRIPNKPIVSLR